MPDMSSRFRRRDAALLLKQASLLEGSCENWIVQGLPNSGADDVFCFVLEAVRNAGIHVVELNLRDYQLTQVADLVRAILEKLHLATDRTGMKNGASLHDLLSGLREEVADVAFRGKATVVALDNFDAFLKYRDPDEVQEMLNTFQSVAYSPTSQTCFIISCNRDIEDICQRVNYSDFYKIFGSNHFRVTEVALEELERALVGINPAWKKELINRIVYLSGGFPEQAEVISRFADRGDDGMEQESLYALRSTFDQWRDCLTAPELEVLKLVSHREILGLEHQEAKEKLLRKSILGRSNGEFRILSPLLEIYISRLVGEVQEEHPTFIRKVAGLPEVHRNLFQQIFRGRYYIQWNYLQEPSDDNATVYIVTGEDTRGVAFRPCILKIDRKERLNEELEKLREARDLLGPVVPDAIGVAESKGLKGMMIEIATADNRNYEVMQFQEYYRRKGPREVEELLTKIFEKALFALYQPQKIAQRKYSSHFFVPRTQRGEFRTLALLCKRSRFYKPETDSLAIPGLGRALPNPGSYLEARLNDLTVPYYRLFGSPRSIGLSRAHGDLNPRNILVDGIDNLHIIDFSEMKDSETGTRFQDMVRLEAEIKFKLTNIDSESIIGFIVIDQMLVQSRNLTDLERLRSLPLDAESFKLLAAVNALRKVARNVCTPPVDEGEIDYEYKLSLLAQTLRIALFSDYLSEVQQDFAIISSAMLADWLLDNEERNA
jgi:hypothetical protein